MTEETKPIVPLPPKFDPTVPDPNRLCSEDMDCGLGDSVCRRSDTILAWESENPGTFLSPNLVWGARDQFFILDGTINYYKPYIQFLLDDINQALQTDTSSTDFQQFITSLRAIVPEIDPTDCPHTFNEVMAIIESEPKGMPKFIKQTDNFLVFEDVTGELITETNIDAATLDLIAATFTSDYTLPYMDPCDTLYLKDGKVYWTDILRWCKPNSPSLRAGIILLGDKYAYYPFGTLDQTTAELVNAYGPKFAEEYTKSFEIITL